jgi:hypothetical protein
MGQIAQSVLSELQRRDSDRFGAAQESDYYGVAHFASKFHYEQEQKFFLRSAPWIFLPQRQERLFDPTSGVT